MAEHLVIVEDMIYTVRGLKVMLDSDLAKLYNIETKRLNQAVKRNMKRFPPEFMFRLSDTEWKDLRSQIVTFSDDTRKYKPNAFTEHGILMLSSVLNSDIAIEINIQIMKVFVKMRQYVIEQSAKDSRIEELHKLLMLHIESNDNKFSEHEDAIRQIVAALNNLLDKPKEPKKIGFKKE